jgi:hypothetical protein
MFHDEERLKASLLHSGNAAPACRLFEISLDERVSIPSSSRPRVTRIENSVWIVGL